MKTQVCRAFFGFLLGALACAVGAAQAPNKLESRGTVDQPIRIASVEFKGEAFTTPQLAGPVFGPLRCDERGQVYMRVGAGPENLLRSPVVRLSSDGQSVAQFDLGTAPSLNGEDFIATQYAVDRYARVHYLARILAKSREGRERLLVLSFGADGRFLREVELEEKLQPLVFAVFPSGRFLLSGTEKQPHPPENQSSMPPKSFTGVFDGNGLLVANIASVEDDLGFQKAGTRWANARLEGGDALVGDDGYLYILKSGSSPEVQVWSEAGTLVRKLNIQQPIPDSLSSDMRLASDIIMVRFQQPFTPEKPGAPRPRVAYGAYASTTGELLFSFEAPDLKGMLTCANATEATYVVLKSGRFAIQRASIH